MDRDANGLEVLDREDCLRLLAAAPVGRIGVSVSALPVVLPVNFVLWNEQIVVRTGVGRKLYAALLNAVVAFEADHYDADRHHGWSVLVQGASRELTEVEDLAEVTQLPLRSWANPDVDRYIAIGTDLVSGRFVGR